MTRGLAVLGAAVFFLAQKAKGAAMRARLCMLSMLLFASAAEAQFASQEVRSFQSADTAVTDLLAGKKGPPITLAGHLRAPKASGKQPTVLLLHGAFGVGGYNEPVGEWSRVLNEAGFAVFIVDSWSGRGLKNIAAEVARVNPMSRIYDLVGALDVLAKNPLVDPSKIAVMGFSHGSSAALYSSLERFGKLFSSDVRFAAHISVYGWCGITFHGDEAVTKPVLMLHGAADDWVPAAPCREYASRLTKAGKNVHYIEYPDAHHGFDAPALARVMKLAQGLSPRRCHGAESEGGIVLNVETKQPFGPSDPCLERGVTLHYNEVAMKKAHGDVLAFLTNVFGQ
jgi:dienelactone hydrolase